MCSLNIQQFNKKIELQLGRVDCGRLCSLRLCKLPFEKRKSN